MTATARGSFTVREWKLRYPLGHAVETVLDRIADAGKSQQTARHALVIMRELFSEAVENKEHRPEPDTESGTTPKLQREQRNAASYCGTGMPTF